MPIRGLYSMPKSLAGTACSATAADPSTRLPADACYAIARAASRSRRA